MSNHLKLYDTSQIVTNPALIAYATREQQYTNSSLYIDFIFCLKDPNISISIFKYSLRIMDLYHQPIRHFCFLNAVAVWQIRLDVKHWLLMVFKK